MCLQMSVKRLKSKIKKPVKRIHKTEHLMFSQIHNDEQRLNVSNRSDQKKTKVKKKTSNPHFEETFFFEVTSASLF